MQAKTLRRLMKRLTIRKRAERLGGKITDTFGWLFTEDPRFKDACRTLIRLQRIRCGLPPFAYQTGQLKDIFVTDTALEGFGNKKRRQRHAS